MREPSALEQRNRTFGIAKTQLQRRIEIARRREPFVEAPQRRVVIRPHQAVDDAAGEVAAYRDLQSCGFKNLFRGAKRSLIRTRLAHDLNQIRRFSFAETKTREAKHVGAFFTATFSGIDTEAFSAEFEE